MKIRVVLALCIFLLGAIFYAFYLSDSGRPVESEVVQQPDKVARAISVLGLDIAGEVTGIDVPEGEEEIEAEKAYSYIGEIGTKPKGEVLYNFEYVPIAAPAEAAPAVSAPVVTAPAAAPAPSEDPLPLPIGGGFLPPLPVVTAPSTPASNPPATVPSTPPPGLPLHAHINLDKPIVYNAIKNALTPETFAELVKKHDEEKAALQ